MAYVTDRGTSKEQGSKKAWIILAVVAVAVLALLLFWGLAEEDPEQAAVSPTIEDVAGGERGPGFEPGDAR